MNPYSESILNLGQAIEIGEFTLKLVPVSEASRSAELDSSESKLVGLEANIHFELRARLDPNVGALPDQPFNDTHTATEPTKTNDKNVTAPAPVRRVRFFPFFRLQGVLRTHHKT